MESSSLIILVLLTTQAILCTVAVQIIVAKDGSGTHKTVSEAIAAAPNNSATSVVIIVKKGVYREQVLVPKSKSNIFLKGEGDNNNQPVIVYDSSFSRGVQTVDTATFGVEADGFVAENIHFSNTAGPHAGQAVAFSSSGDKTALHRCTIEAYQDTLYTQRGRHFIRDTNIYGTIDFIFGDSKAVFQNCNIFFRVPATGQADVLTAQGRESIDSTTGIVLHNCTLSSDPHSPESPGGAYLGRPWKAFSRTVIMESYIDIVVNKERWLPWGQNESLNQVYYAEYNNRGPRADTRGRHQCPGCKVITRQEAEMFSVRKFLDSDDWISSTGIPFSADLIT